MNMSSDLTNLLFAGKESSLQACNPTRRKETNAGTTQLTALVKGSHMLKDHVQTV